MHYPNSSYKNTATKRRLAQKQRELDSKDTGRSEGNTDAGKIILHIPLPKLFELPGSHERELHLNMSKTLLISMMWIQVERQPLPFACRVLSRSKAGKNLKWHITNGLLTK